MQVLSEPDVAGLLDRLMAEVLPSRRGLAAWRALLRSHATVMRQLDAAVGHASVPSSVRRFGFWSAMATAITYAVFLVGYFIGSYLRPPWDIAIPVAASILIAPSFVLLTVGIHYATPESKRIWSHAAMAFALLYAAFVSIVYVTWLFVVEPHVLNHSRSAVAPFVFKRGSFVQMLDGLGYTYMSLASA